MSRKSLVSRNYISDTEDEEDDNSVTSSPSVRLSRSKITNNKTNNNNSRQKTNVQRTKRTGSSPQSSRAVTIQAPPKKVIRVDLVDDDDDDNIDFDMTDEEVDDIQDDEVDNDDHPVIPLKYVGRTAVEINQLRPVKLPDNLFKLMRISRIKNKDSSYTYRPVKLPAKWEDISNAKFNIQRRARKAPLPKITQGKIKSVEQQKVAHRVFADLPEIILDEAHLEDYELARKQKDYAHMKLLVPFDQFILVIYRPYDEMGSVWQGEMTKDYRSAKANLLLPEEESSLNWFNNASWIRQGKEIDFVL